MNNYTKSENSYIETSTNDRFKTENSTNNNMSTSYQSSRENTISNVNHLNSSYHSSRLNTSHDYSSHLSNLKKLRTKSNKQRLGKFRISLQPIIKTVVIRPKVTPQPTRKVQPEHNNLLVGLTKDSREKSYKRFYKHERMSRKNSRSNSPSLKSDRSSKSAQSNKLKINLNKSHQSSRSSSKKKLKDQKEIDQHQQNCFSDLSKFLDTKDKEFYKINKKDTETMQETQRDHFDSLMKQFKHSTDILKDEGNHSIRPSKFQKKINARLGVKDSTMYEHYGKNLLKTDPNFYNFYNSKWNTNKMEKDELSSHVVHKKDELPKGQIDFNINRKYKDLFKNYIKFQKKEINNNSKFPMLRFNFKINEQELKRKINHEYDYMGRADNYTIYNKTIRNSDFYDELFVRDD